MTDPTRIPGRYQVLGTLGEGGMGVLYRVRDEATGAEVALKATIHATLRPGVDADQARAHLTAQYAAEPFVSVLASGSASTHQVRGTNQCVMSLHAGRQEGELIIVSVFDNLVKGASGQALQNANAMSGLPETTNLELTAIFP